MYKDALEMWHIFTIAAQEAKKKNLNEFQYNISVDELAGFIQKAFPNKDSVSALKMAEKILNN